MSKKRLLWGLLFTLNLWAGQVYALEGFSFRPSYEENMTPKVTRSLTPAELSTLTATFATPVGPSQKELVDATNKAVAADTGDEENAKNLRELKFGSALKFVNGNTNTSLVPVINLSYSDEINGQLLKLRRKYFKERRTIKNNKNGLDPTALKQKLDDLETQYKKEYAEQINDIAKDPKHLFYYYSLEVKPEPSAGSVEDVSQIIRLDSGTFSFDGGFIGRYVQNDPIDNAPFGPVISAKLKVAYQKAQTDSTSTASPGLKRTEFYMLSPEIALGYWLKAAFIGYKYIYNTTSGGDTNITNEVNKTSVHKLTALFNINQAYRQAQDNVDPKTDPSPYLLEIDYTGGKNTFGDGTLSFSVVKQFNFF